MISGLFKINSGAPVVPPFAPSATAGRAAVPVSPGTQSLEVSVSVTVVYALA